MLVVPRREHYLLILNGESRRKAMQTLKLQQLVFKDWILKDVYVYGLDFEGF